MMMTRKIKATLSSERIEMLSSGVIITVDCGFCFFIFFSFEVDFEV